MRNSLYDALEVNSSSSTDAIKAALRTVVRRFWAVPRDASGDSEEAVRFAALAAAILVDPVRRKDYDAALNPGVGAGPWRLPIASRDPVAEGGTHSRVLSEEDSGEVSQLSIVAAPPKALPGVDALAEPLPDGTAWTSPLVWVALFVAWLLLWFALALPFPEWFDLSIGKALLFSMGAMAALFACAAWLSRPQEVAGAAAGLSRLAIIKWRREGSIFIGTPPPQHDTAWIFKLRLMELTRSAAGFVTSSSPWRRLAARLVDYALVAVALYMCVYLIDQIVPVLDEGFVLVRSALVLPTLVVLSAIPASAMFHRLFGNTPGKWLFSLQLVIGITRPADHAEPTDRRLLWARASRVAWSGAALGVWPIALFLLPRNLRLARDTETDWESYGDSLLMARPLTTQAVATGLVILLAASLILMSGWRRDYIAVWPRLVSMTIAAQTSMANAFPAKSGNAVAGPAASPREVADAPIVSSTPLPPSRSGASTEPDRLPEINAAPPAVPVTPTLRPLSLPIPPVGVATSESSKAVSPITNSVAEAEMSRQAAASLARRQRIDGYARQTDAARRSGSYAALQGSCQRWTQDQPGSADAWRCFGLAQFQNGAGRAALPALRQALKIEPQDAQVESAIMNILRP